MMLCYKDKTYCTATECLTKECHRHQGNINQRDLELSGLNLMVADFYKDCEKFSFQMHSKE